MYVLQTQVRCGWGEMSCLSETLTENLHLYKKCMEDFSFKMPRTSGMQCNHCYGSEQGLVPRKTILDKNGWSMTLLRAKAKRNARFSCYSLRLCTKPEGTPPPIALHLYLCGKSGENERKIIKGVSDLKHAHHASPPAVSASLPSLQPPACAPILRLQVENMGLSPGSPALGGLAIWLHFASSPPLSDGAVGAVCLVGLLERVRNACQVLSPGASAT